MSIKYVKPKSYRQIEKAHRPMYRQIKRDFGMIAEPFLLHSPNPELMAGVWAVVRETVLVGEVPRAQKEIIATCVSKSNDCPYCVDAHATMLASMGDSSYLGLTERVDVGESTPLQQWAMSTKNPNAAIVQSPPFDFDQAPEMIGTAVAFHYINKMVTVFLDDSPIPSSHPLIRRILTPMVALFFSVAVKREKQKGEALVFLPRQEMLPSLYWAAPSPTIAQAFTQFSVVIERSAKAVLPESVREHFQHYVYRWDGSESGLGRAWVNPITEIAKTQSEKDLLRLLLLTALAPYQLDRNTIKQGRQILGSDEALIAALSWASFTVAARIGEWLSQPFESREMVC